MPSDSLRIAVLECDTLVGHMKESYGSYANLFQELLQKGAKRVLEKDGVYAPKLDVRKYDVVNDGMYPNLEDVDAVLLSGSLHDAFDDANWILNLIDFTKKVLTQKRVRLLGVCFGHQIIGRALGQEVGKSDRGWEVSVTRMELTEKGKELFDVQGLALHQMHRDVVYTCPPCVELLGHSPRCDVQGMYEKKRLITVQGHPEFNENMMMELLGNRYEKRVLNDSTYIDGMDRVRQHQDGVAVSAAFIRFLLEQ